MQELWQLYNEDGQPLTGQGAAKDEVFKDGLLHGAAHIWVWCRHKNSLKVLVQKRAASKRTWPNRYDISAAGHIDLGETPLTAALRETQEEIGLDVTQGELAEVAVHRAHLKTDDGSIENEFQWIYLLELSALADFNLQANEVSAVEWLDLEEFKRAVRGTSEQYVPHGPTYFEAVFAALESNFKSWGLPCKTTGFIPIISSKKADSSGISLSM